VNLVDETGQGTEKVSLSVVELSSGDVQGYLQALPGLASINRPCQGTADTEKHFAELSTAFEAGNEVVINPRPH